MGICVETETEFRHGDRIRVARPAGKNFATALSEGVIAAIPHGERSTRQVEYGGVNIFHATAVRGPGGPFVIGRFDFSITRETAKRYLPKLSRMIVEE